MTQRVATPVEIHSNISTKIVLSKSAIEKNNNFVSRKFLIIKFYYHKSFNTVKYRHYLINKLKIY